MAEEKKVDEEKELKKLLDSHVTVLKHKLGRVPTAEEIVAGLSDVQKSDDGAMEPNRDINQNSSVTVPNGETTEGPGAQPRVQSNDPAQQQEPAQPEPKIFGLRVFYGMRDQGDGQRKPDPFKILFYEAPDRRVYDTTQHQWVDTRPGVMDHLPSRELMFDERGHDIMSAILHGVLDQEDYNSLASADLLNDHHKEVWELNQQLQQQAAGLEKSSGIDDTSGETPKQDSGAATTPTAEVAQADAKIDSPRAEPMHKDTPADAAAAAGGKGPDAAPASQSESPTPPEGEPGQNLIEQIVQAALAKADGQLRRIVREEIQQAIGEIMDNMPDETPEEPAGFQTYSENPGNGA